MEKNSIFALLGSNGEGKTTIVKNFTTLLKQYHLAVFQSPHSFCVYGIDNRLKRHYTCGI